MESIPWLDWLYSHVGETFLTGSKPTEFNRMVFSHTHYGDIGNVLPPGCAATLCAALELTGFKSTKRADAISFKNYGEKCELKEGAILVIEHPKGGHHVTVCARIVAGKFEVDCIGGNQSHKLQVSRYKFQPGGDKIIACRWPTKG